ncbi:MAG: CDP-alcohol phosphatidyltransferase family protein, partial [Candidatus Acidiferrum sp.]
MDYINRMQLYAELPARLQIGREFRQARRIQQSLLSNLERKALLWLAQRTPRYINSDHLTLLGLSAMLVAGAAFAYAQRNPLALWLVMVCLAVNWLGDSLDGTLARFRKQQRPRYGFYVDHIVDAIGTLALFAGMAYSGYMAAGVAAALLIAYLLLSIE